MRFLKFFPTPARGLISVILWCALSCYGYVACRPPANPLKLLIHPIVLLKNTYRGFRSPCSLKSELRRSSARGRCTRQRVFALAWVQSARMGGDGCHRAPWVPDDGCLRFRTNGPHSPLRPFDLRLQSFSSKCHSGRLDASKHFAYSECPISTPTARTWTVSACKGSLTSNTILSFLSSTFQVNGRLLTRSTQI